MSGVVRGSCIKLSMVMGWVWSGCQRILGPRVVGLVQIFTHEFADSDIRNDAGLEWIIDSLVNVHWTSANLSPINPHKKP
jgi:hypothetical protein